MSGFVERLQQLLRSGDQLPTLPAVVFQVHAVLDDERAGAEEVGEVIAQDPALTARLLRAANSALFSRGGDRIGEVPAAIQRVGLRQVRALCLVLGVVQAFGDRRRSLSHDALWSHSAAVGAVARRLSAGMANEAYVAGLLHDVGLLVLDQFFPEEFDRLMALRQEIDLPLWQHEEDLLGMDHGDVGGLLLGSWNLPAPLVDAVTTHHRPHEAPGAHALLCRTVHAAEVVCGELGAGLDEEGQGGPTAAEALARLGLAAGSAELQAELREVSDRARGSLV